MRMISIWRHTPAASRNQLIPCLSYKLKIYLSLRMREFLFSFHSFSYRLSCIETNMQVWECNVWNLCGLLRTTASHYPVGQDQLPLGWPSSSNSGGWLEDMLAISEQRDNYKTASEIRLHWWRALKLPKVMARWSAYILAWTLAPHNQKVFEIVNGFFRPLLSENPQ